MAEHSPGPWEAIQGAYSMSRTEFAVFQEGAEGNGDKRIACWIRTKADADLVAAAPALLAACQAYIHTMDRLLPANPETWDLVTQAIRDAVKLATEGTAESP